MNWKVKGKSRLYPNNLILILRVLNGCKTVYKEILVCVLASAYHNFLRSTRKWKKLSIDN